MEERVDPWRRAAVPEAKAAGGPSASNRPTSLRSSPPLPELSRLSPPASLWLVLFCRRYDGYCDSSAGGSP